MRQRVGLALMDIGRLDVASRSNSAVLGAAVCDPPERDTRGLASGSGAGVEKAARPVPGADRRRPADRAKPGAVATTGYAIVSRLVDDDHGRHRDEDGHEVEPLEPDDADAPAHPMIQWVMYIDWTRALQS